MSAAMYSRLLGEFQRGFHESTDTRVSVEIRSPGSFHRGWEPSELDTVNYETEAVIASVAVPYSVGSDASTHAVAVTTREYWQPPELLQRFKRSCSEAGAILPLAIRGRLPLDWEISRHPTACWMSLLTWLHGFTVRDADGRYLEHQLITNPWGSCADAIEYLRLNTDSPGWPDEVDQTSAEGDASADDESSVLKLQAFAVALRLVGQKTTAIDAALKPIIAEQESEIDRLKAEYRDVVQRIESDWEAEFGAPYPKDIDDWYRWAWRAGFPSDRILKGDWKLSELFPCIEGYLLRLRDQHGSAEAQTKGRGDDAGENRMSWQEAAERMERLRQQGERFTSQPKLAEQFGCSSGTINKAIRNTESLHAWAKVSSATPKAQSINPVVTDNVPQATELSPEDDAAIREYLERDDITPDERAVFLAKSTADQIAFLNFLADDPDARDGTLHKRILGRKP